LRRKLKKALFLIRSLNIGGAEKQLLTLLQGMDKTKIDPVVVTFYPGGELLPDFNRQNLRVLSAGKTGRWDIFSFISGLLKIIHSEKPDVIVSYLVAANLLGILLKLVYRPTKLAISIRHSFIRNEDYDVLNGILYFLQDKLAWISDRIIANSSTGARMAIARGMPKEKMVVIPNGIDTDHFYPDVTGRVKNRKDYRITDKAPVVGIIGRIDPTKDHANFIQAAVKVVSKIPGTKFLIVGSGEPSFESQLRSFSQSLGMEEKIIWIPSQKDLLGIYNCLDVCVSASVGEGFSNVIAEAMACGIPCVVTDVGDSALIVGESGKIVSVGNPDELSANILEILDMPEREKQQLARLARERIVSEFSVQKMVNATMKEIESLG
jgi:glycosyltransferase involved in cell wall biosynthesis